MEYAASHVRRFITEAFEHYGAPKHIAEEVSRHLVDADLKGHPSHGINRVPQYLNRIRQGDVLPAEEPEVLKQNGGSILVDAKRGIGQYSTRYALDLSMDLARKNGVAVCAVRHSTHVGRLGDYAEAAANKGLMSIITVGIAGLDLGWMMPPGGKRRFIGANPWAFGAPTSTSPVIYDASTTNVAQGKIAAIQR